jgi:hypothetical protein
MIALWGGGQFERVSLASSTATAWGFLCGLIFDFASCNLHDQHSIAHYIGETLFSPLEPRGVTLFPQPKPI